ncbi:hypothetical protein PAECIP111891_05484 [Paenibacillus allorhizoplanae]|uniref:KOW domain-containing protein n=2 Tax=Paenibacillus TaxID=44249 RepID=A0ABX1XHB3_9BACL|nr:MULTISPECIES: hypothetical protein [Paenibacillus]NOU67826.1 hypothetical protein [Paenibacillus plantarum]CAH1223266.1 hypothetical protein PAECIP111891_05484 [Paenibacillus allorhizoplanae]
MTRSDSYLICKKYLNREVTIKTTHGTYRGTIVKVDGHKVYLKQTRNGKKAHISFLPFLLPLVLFDLLAIFLVESRPCSPFRPFL